ncbi:MAG: Hpt domain-containing protein [Treponema sp.]|nr:Hpt domain-containing protein [Treponema sp.]
MSELLLDAQTGLDLVDNDMELYKILLNGFLTDNSFDIEYLQDLYNKNKLDECASYVHRVKGSARQIAAKFLAQKGQELEDLFRKKNGPLTQFPQQQAKDFADAYEKTKPAVIEFYNMN